MILFFILATTWPFLEGMFSPDRWRYAAALELQKTEQFAEARQIYEGIAARKPKQAVTWYRLAEISAHEEHFEEALSHINKANEYASPEQKYYFLNFKAKLLLSLKQNRSAVQTMLKLLPMTALPADFRSLSADELAGQLGKASHRQFLNGLAYVSAIGGVDLMIAKKMMDAVISHFEQEDWNASLCIPYLYERTSQYEKALAAYQAVLQNIRKEITGYDAKFQSMLELKSQLAELPGEEVQKKTILSKRLVALEKVLSLKKQWLILNRIQLLAEQSDNDIQVNEVRRQLAELSSEKINNEEVNFELNDAVYYSLAFELHHYFDTRAVVHMALGDAAVANMIDNQTNGGEFWNREQTANLDYQQAKRDIEVTLELQEVLKLFEDRFPENSQFIAMPSDTAERKRSVQRNEAVERNHYSRVLWSLGYEEQAMEEEKKVRLLGFQPGPQLF